MKKKKKNQNNTKIDKIISLWKQITLMEKFNFVSNFPYSFLSTPFVSSTNVITCAHCVPV